MIEQFNHVSYDANQNFGSDLSLSANQDIQNVAQLDKSKQRILRRLLTNPGTYIWHPTYGAGLPNFIGLDLNIDRFDELKSLIISQIFLEASVSKNPAPEIIFQTIQGGFFVQINYTHNPSLQPIVLTFPVT